MYDYHIRLYEDHRKAESVLLIAAKNAGEGHGARDAVTNMAALHSHAATGGLPGDGERLAAKSALCERIGADLVRILNEETEKAK